MSITLHHRISHLHEWDTRSKYNQPPGSPPQGSSSGPVGIWSGDNGDTYCQQNYEYWSTDVSRPHRHTPLLKSSWIRVPCKIVFANNDFGRYTKYKMKIKGHLWMDQRQQYCNIYNLLSPHPTPSRYHMSRCLVQTWGGRTVCKKKILDFIKTLKTQNIFNEH